MSDYNRLNIINVITTKATLIYIVNILSEKVDTNIKELSYELDSTINYNLMRQQLDNLEVLDEILNLTNKLNSL